ncbi:hypothetical protein GVAV_001406 [Gurleya vavrai]
MHPYIREMVMDNVKDTTTIDFKDDFDKKELDFNLIIIQLEEYSLHIHFFKTIFFEVLSVINETFVVNFEKTENDNSNIKIPIMPFYNINEENVQNFKKNARKIISTKLKDNSNEFLNDIKYLSEDCLKIPERLYLIEQKIFLFIYNFYKKRICSCLENLKNLKKSLKINKLMHVDKNKTAYAITTEFYELESSINNRSEIKSSNKTDETFFLTNLNILIKNIEDFVSELDSVNECILEMEKNILKNPKIFYNHFYECFENFIKNNSEFFELRINDKLNEQIQFRKIQNIGLSMMVIIEFNTNRQTLKTTIKDRYKEVLKKRLHSDNNFCCAENLLQQFYEFLDKIIELNNQNKIFQIY